ncbi:hypothetical protein H7I41_12870 [Mycobacterium manitobense]|uniref:Secreted protein n=1 Tax=[Mycobacterium] manitobense TaxID=190147 RepID=A0A9X3BVS5_9MYCO|nr:hypothetical protein [[Mycobacterium] manitobense]MCV7170806.1 hypothetical protein [[Mycobacterium] manitobense]
MGALVAGATLLSSLFAGTGTAKADDRCTNQINYAGDPRSNAEINSIGASTGQCPVSIPQQNSLPGLVDGAIEGAACYNWMRYQFGQTSTGAQMICADQGNGTGEWIRAIPVIGEREIGSQCASEQQYGAQSPDGRPLVCDVQLGWLPS